MEINSSIFKAYDIRGIYPTELDGFAAYRIGRAYIKYLRHNPVLEGKIQIVVSADARASSPELKAELIKGMCDEDANLTVIDAGLSTTPMHYFLINHFNADGGVMVTASHNPKQYNGFKLSRRGAVPIFLGAGMEEVQNTVMRGIFETPTARGTVEEKTALDAYIDFLISSVDVASIKPFRIVCDLGNGMAGLVLPKLLERLPVKAKLLFADIDMAFPNHEANPLNEETLEDLKAAVQEEKADFGVAFDGDGDRIGFVTEQAEQVRGDFITALLAEYVLKQNAGGKVVYDLRSSRAVPEHIQELGGVPLESRVGHVFFKTLLRNEQAVVGGEISGHYYFRDFFNADSALFAFLTFLKLMSESDKSLSVVLKPLQRYAVSGELNFTVANKDQSMDAVAAHFHDGKVAYLDGLSIEYPDFWFNLRASNTEPLLRLNLEARTQEILDKKLQEIQNFLK